MSKRTSALIALVAVVVVGGLAISLFSSQREKKNEGARDAWFKASQAYEKERHTAAQYAQSLPLLKKVVADYSGTRPAIESLFILGSIYQELGQTAEAQAAYQQVTRDSKEAMDQEMAHSSLGYLLEAQGKYSESVEAFKKAIGVGGLWKGEHLLSIARQYTLMKDTAHAKETYDQLIKELPNSSQARRALSLKAD